MHNYVDKDLLGDLIYLDIKKAFDEVPQKRLLWKLYAHGIDVKILTWIEE